MSGLYNVWATEGHKSTGPQWDSTSHTFRAMAITTGYTFNPDLDTVDDGTTSDLRSYESSGTGYTPGYQSTNRVAFATTGRTVTVDDANNRARVDADNITFSSIDVGAIGGVAVIVEVGTSDTSSLPCMFFHATDLSSGGVTTNGGDFTINWSTVGLAVLTV